MPKIHNQEVSEKKIAKRIIRFAMADAFDWRKGRWKHILKQITDDEISKINQEINNLYKTICDKFNLPDNLW